MIVGLNFLFRRTPQHDSHAHLPWQHNGRLQCCWCALLAVSFVLVPEEHGAQNAIGDCVACRRTHAHKTKQRRIFKSLLEIDYYLQLLKNIHKETPINKHAALGSECESITYLNFFRSRF